MNVQTEYYIRLLLVLVQCGMLVCRGVLERHIGGRSLDVCLQPQQTKLRKKLLKSQYLILFPKKGNPDVEDLDLSLLTVVLLDVFILSTTDQHNIRVIKDTRNKLSHNETASLVEADYNKMKTNLVKALEQLSQGLDVKLQNESTKLIKKFTCEPLDESAALKYIKKLRNEDELIQDIEGLQEKQSEDILKEINASECRIQETMSDMEERLTLQIQGHTDDLAYRKFPDTLPTCENCIHLESKNISAIFCEDCTKFLCLKCNECIHTGKEKHRRKRIFKDKPIKIDTKGYDVCFEHRKCLAYICESENELCCDDCHKEKHQHCAKIITIAEKPFEPMSNPTMEIMRLQNEIDCLNTWFSSVEADGNKNEEHISTMLVEYRKSLLEKFDKEAQEIRERAAVINSSSVKDIKRKRKSCEDINDEIKRAKLSLINMSKCGTETQKRISQYTMEKFSDNIKSLKDINIISLCSTSIKPPAHILQQPISLSPIHVNIPQEWPLQLVPINRFQIKKKREEKKKPLYSGIDYFPDGRLGVVDNFNGMFLVYDDNKLERLVSYKLPYVPLSMVILSNEEVAITSRKMIIILHVTKTNKVALHRTLDIKSSSDSICLKDVGHIVCGTYNTTKPANIVSLTGEEEDFNLDFLNNEHKFGASYCTFLRFSNKVVISERYENTVTIYDVTTNTRKIVKDDQIQEPKGMAVGPFDCIFVCSKLTNSIVQISPKGDIIASHKVDMPYPCRICFSKDKTRLAITNSEERKRILNVYKVDFSSH